MHPENLKCLTEAKIDYCSLANNHTLDFQLPGMIDTMKSLSEQGIKWAGVGMNKQEAMKPAILERCGMKFAFYRYVQCRRIFQYRLT
jgi:poly-gamma-glutamate synthesis protein (capsule biosynthesis protein)